MCRPSFLSEIWLTLSLVVVASVQQVPAAADDAVSNTFKLPAWSGKVTALVRDQEGFLWVGAQDGLFRFDGQRFREYDVYSEGTPPFTPSVTALTVDPAGRLWIGTRHGVSVKMKGASRVEFVISSTEHRSDWPPTLLPSDVVLAIAAGSHDSIWVATEGCAITRISFARSAETTRCVAESRPSQRVSEIVETATGELLIAGDFDGLTILSTGSDGSPVHETSSQGLGRVSAIEKIGDEIWIAAHASPGGGKVAILNRDFRSFQLVGRPVADEIEGFAISPSGSSQARPAVAVATGSRVIKLGEAGAGNEASEIVLRASRIDDLLIDGHGMLWAAHDGQLSTMALNRDGIRFHELMTPAGDSPTITAFAMDRDSDLWLGTSGSGVLRLAQGKDTPGTSMVRPVSESLRASRINALAGDAAGRMWIASATGLVGLDEDGNRVEVRGDLGDFSSTPVQTLLRERNLLFIGGQAGIAILDLDSLDVIHPSGHGHSGNFNDLRVTSISACCSHEILFLGH